MFTVEELQLILKLVENTPVQGTLLTLPDLLRTLASVRAKVKGMLDPHEGSG